jgi:hypothetical protein
MVSSHYSAFDSNNVSFVNIDDKSITVNGQKIVYKTAKFCYDHENDSGQVTTGDMSFEMPELTVPYGMELEKGYKLKGRFEFARSSEEASDCVSSIETTQTKGWVARDEVDVDMDVGSCTATPKEGSVSVYKNPGSTETVGHSSETMQVVGKSPDKKFLSVVYGGTDGFFAKLRKCMASQIFTHKAKFDLGDKTQEDIMKMLSNPVYISKDNKTGKVHDRDPAVYFDVIYYPKREARGDKPAMEESLAKFEVPGMEECLDLNVLMSKRIKCVPTVKMLHITKSGSKLSMKLAVTNACVTDIDDIKREVRKSNTYTKYSQDKALVDKLAAKMKKVKAESPSPPVNHEKEMTVPDNSPVDNEEEFNLESMLNSDAPTLEEINLDND